MNPADTPPETLLRPAARSRVAQTVLATLAVIAALWWGRSFMIPLTAGVMLALLVTPLTNLLERLLRSRFVATLLTLMAVVAALVLAGIAFGDQLTRVAGRAPDLITLVADQISATDPGADSVMRRVRESVRRLDRAADRLSGGELATPTSASTRRPAAARVAASTASAAASAAPVNIEKTATVALGAGAISGS